MVEHTVKAFDEDITRLRGLIAEMGGLAEVAIQQSLQALVQGDEELASEVVKRDAKLDALETEVDAMAVRILALRAPMADDLREIVAALKIGGVVERIGDYAKNIAKRVGRIEGRSHFEPLTLLPAMGELAAEMEVPVLEYPVLARAVYFTTREQQMIRAELYSAIASVLAFVMSLKRGEHPQRPHVGVPLELHFDAEGRPHKA